VTLALIVQKLDALTAEVRKVNEDHEDRLRVLEKQVGQLAERLSIWQLGQAAFTSVVGVIASVIGIRVQ